MYKCPDKPDFEARLSPKMDIFSATLTLVSQIFCTYTKGFPTSDVMEIPLT